MSNVLQILTRIIVFFVLFVPHTVFGGCLNVTSPAAGVNWKTTQTYNIQWNTTSTKPTVDIYLYKNGSRKYTIVSDTPNDGQYEWTIPANTLINKYDEGNIYYISMCTDDCCGDGAVFSIYFPIPETPCCFQKDLVSAKSANFTWGTVYGPTGYEIYNCDTNTVAASRYDWFYLGGTVTNLLPDTTYSFKMRAVNTSGQSPFTSCVQVTTASTEDLIVSGTAVSPYEISLAWNPIAGATDYDIRSCSGTSIKTNHILTTFSHTGLTPATTYGYEVKADIIGGEILVSSPCKYVTTPSDSYSISGTVTENSGGLQDVAVSFAGYSATTGTDGSYTISNIPAGTSGNITASKNGCVFSPSSIPVSNISSNLTGKNFTATCSVTISGKVKKTDGTPILAVDVTFTGLTPVTTITGGVYSKTVPAGWTGNVCATKTGCNFSCVSVSNITADRPNTDLICATVTYPVSGYTKRYNGETVSGALVTFSGLASPVTSGSNGYNGYFEKYVDYGWSGTISASKSGYSFSSENISTVTAPRPGNNIYGDYYPRTGTSATVSVKESSWNTRYSEQNTKPCNKTEGHCGDPVDTSTGAQILEYDLLSVQGLIPISFNLAYNSLVVSEQGPAGKGWDFNYGFGAKITPADAEAVNVIWSKNRTNRFNHIEAGVYGSSEDACRYDRLIKNADSTYTLTGQDKTVYTFNVNGLLSELRDAQNRRLLFSYDASARLTRITEPVSGAYLNYAYNAQGLLQTVSDPVNRQVSLSYDSDRLKTITDPDGHTITFAWNTDGRILSALSSEGYRLFSNTFDSQGRVIAQDDGLSTNQPITISYDESQEGKIITTITDRNGASRRYTYNEHYHLLEKVDELGNVSAVYTYDENGNRITATDGNSHTTGFGYDTNGNMTTVSDAAGNMTQMIYDANSNLTSATDALGKKVALEYDSFDRVICSTDPLNNITEYAYDSNGQLISVKTPQGNITRYEYKNGLPAKIIFSQGNTQEMSYDASGRMISVKDGEGNTTAISYDDSCSGSCRAESITDPLGNKVSMTYDSRGSLLTITDANGNVTRYEYDANGNMIRMINALSQITRYEYDGEDRLIKVTDAKGNVSALTYDAKGRTVSVADALGNTRTMAYDKTLNLKIVKDAYGTVIQSLNYDVSDNLTQMKDALNNAAAFEYDEVNRLIKTIDPMNRVTQFTYDALDSLISSTDPMGGTASQLFDKEGNLTKITDPSGNSTAFAYDKNGRQISETSAAGNTVQYTYNARDLIQSLTNARGQNRQFVYDAAGRLIQMSDPDGVITTYTYDANGNVLTVTDSVGTITRKYDALNRVTEYTDATGNVIKYEFDVVGNLTGLIYPDGKKVVYGYDNANRLVRVTDWNGRQTAYSYDKESRLVQTTRPNGTVMTTRSYNSAGQLLQQKDLKTTGEIIAQYDFTYDAAGNITAERVIPVLEMEPVIPATMTYSAANRLAGYNGQSVSHDADGNMTRGPLNGGMANFNFDSRNRLRQVETTVYTYDAENNRIAVYENSVQTKYVINPQAELSQVLIREDHDGTKTYYVYGVGLIGQERNGAYRSFHFDFRGSTVAMTDGNGIITHQYAYGAYGKVLVLNEESFNPFRYVGQYGVMFDGNGLYYMRNRYYNCKSKKFISYDTIIGGIENSTQLNRFLYSLSNPINRIDPLGLWSFKEFIGGIKYKVKKISGLDKGYIINRTNEPILVSSSMPDRGYGQFQWIVPPNTDSRYMKNSFSDDVDAIYPKDGSVIKISGRLGSLAVYDYNSPYSSSFKRPEFINNFGLNKFTKTFPNVREWKQQDGVKSIYPAGYYRQRVRRYEYTKFKEGIETFFPSNSSNVYKNIGGLRTGAGYVADCVN